MDTSCETEISDLHDVTFTDQHVTGGQVTMYTLRGDKILLLLLGRVDEALNPRIIVYKMTWTE